MAVSIYINIGVFVLSTVFLKRNFAFSLRIYFWTKTGTSKLRILVSARKKCSMEDEQQHFVAHLKTWRQK
jgi:hypothetical protein